MFIRPISNIKTFEEISNSSLNSGVGQGNPIPFKDMFIEAIDSVKQTDSDMQEAVVKAATGEIDDLHNLSIASSKASMALDLVIQLRNKSLDAYNEIMRMSV